MAGFLAALWTPGDRETAERLRVLDRAAKRQPAWSWKLRAPGLRVLTGARAPLGLRRLNQDSVVIGDLFRRDLLGVRVDENIATDSPAPEAACREMLKRYWGRYVAILRTPDGATSVFRDPSGALDCLIWREAGVTFVATDLPLWLHAFLPRSVAVDWSRVEDMLLDSSQLALEPGLRGVGAVPPGAIQRLGPSSASVTTLWAPSQFAGLNAASRKDALDELPRLVDGCVGAYAGNSRLLAEISGGLDSAIVASAIVRASAPTASWLNYHVADRQGDERLYARAVAGRLGLDLTEALKSEASLSRAGLAESSTNARPGLNGLDAQYDQDVLDRCLAAGADRILTGQGGDTVFYQMATPLIAADHLQQAGLTGLNSSVSFDIARWTRQSLWSVLRIAAVEAAGWGGGAARTPPDFLSAHLRRRAKAMPVHPWLADQDLSPAKRRQVQGLAHTQLFYGACARSRGADLIHPLLSQPIVEYALGLSAVAQTEGGRDRALARAAFAGRLPDTVIQRRSKGAMTAYYGRMLAASLPVLRPMLLEGRLAAQGLVDRSRLEVILDEDDLIVRGHYGELMTLTAIEGWVGHWDR